ncbi:MAG: ATP-dependent DNA helicase RecG [Lachnospiraceae bacterium]|nr:ATP-dependent DNA helicase RecG [Lachnospiraceae bacterium]
MNLNTPITNLKGVGEKTAAILNRLHIYTYEDLINYFPREYMNYEPPISVADVKIGNTQTVSGCVSAVNGPIKAGRYSIITVVIKDGLNILEVLFFNQPYIKKTVKIGGYYLFRGKVIQKGTRLIMQSPKLYSRDEYQELLGHPVPVYALTSGLKGKTVTKAVNAAIRDIQWDDEIFPAGVLSELKLVSHSKAIGLMHNPGSDDDIQTARRRLAFEDFFYFIMLLRKNRDLSVTLKNAYPMIETADTRRFIEKLPFKLTSGQKKTWQQICEDMSGAGCMNRLVQGDVGSGKTIVAILALLMTACNGYQGALMAPTEVLATQHMETVTDLIKKYDIPLKPVLLVGSMKASEKKAAYASIASGDCNLIIGTHALIQDKVEYKNLALVVTDEQHRFGVRQREALAGKGNQPHILVMSATPIPRTLAIILYGDLHLSAIHELPADRLPIKNCVVKTDYRPSAYKFIADQVAAGRQAYVICSQVEAGENDDLENVIDYCEKLKDVLPKLKISYLHGKMKANEKNNIMQNFADGNIDVLVSTTVIEVGINVPNSTVMMVENAERFGLAQLHQLRGRVGRGKHQSYCIFISSNEEKKTMERLNILAGTNDGFKIASEDLRLRGPGEFFGVRQSGEFSFKVGDIYADSALLEETNEYVDKLLADDPKLTKDENQKIKNSVIKYYEKSEMLQSI